MLGVALVSVSMGPLGMLYARWRGVWQFDGVSPVLLMHYPDYMLARPAAIKLIRPEMIAQGDSGAAQLAVKCFRREAEVAANLRSPHTVALYDFGIPDDRSLYFVMELLEGMDLDKLVRTHGPLPPARVSDASVSGTIS